MKHFKLSTWLLTFILLPGFAQRTIGTNQNSWFVYNGDHKISARWGLHIEEQYRRSEGLKGFQQNLIRLGVNYHLNANVFATAGYSYIYTNAYGVQPSKSAFPENRIYQQIQTMTKIDRVEYQNRLRLEQRFVHAPVQNGSIWEAGNAVYTNRIRLMNRWNIPLNHKTITDKTLFISFMDEIMVNFGKKVKLNTFDQNRAYAALGYRIPKYGRLELGYLNQLILKSDGVQLENNHTVQLALNSSLDFYKKKK